MPSFHNIPNCSAASGVLAPETRQRFFYQAEEKFSFPRCRGREVVEKISRNIMIFLLILQMLQVNVLVAFVSCVNFKLRSK